MRSVSVNDDSSKKLINSSHSSLQLLPPKATDSDRLLTLFSYFFPQVCYPATCSTPSWTGTATHTMPRPAPSQMRKPSTLPLQVTQVTIIYLFNELEWSTASRKYVMMMMALAVSCTLVAWFNPVLKLSRKFVNMFPKHEVFMCNFWLKSC